MITAARVVRAEEGSTGTPEFLEGEPPGKPVGANPERVVAVAVPVAFAVEPAPVVELTPDAAPVGVADTPEIVRCAPKRSDDWNLTQFDDAGIRGVYGIVKTGPSDSGGCEYDVV